jgi:hypothetical protein
MLAILILVISTGALGQFFFAYCRSLLRTYSQVEISPLAREVSGIADDTQCESAFPRIMLLVGLDPERGDDRAERFFIRLYYTWLSLPGLLGRYWPALAYWVTAEREDCAHFAAVALDRRIGTKITDLSWR